MGENQELVEFPELEPDDILLVKQLTGDDKGAYGNVWRGKCFGNPVAVKIPKNQDLGAEELRQLRNEILLSFKHPHSNIVLFMGACMQPKCIRIVVELMDGDVSDLIKDPTLSLLDLLEFARQAALGMEWLHGVSHIIHRDLKPANLLYRRNGDKFTIKVGDFGLAVIKKDREQVSEIAGSPLYSAPEVLAGKGYKEEVDIYSFGICLWEIVTKGKNEPFSHIDHGDDFDTFKNIVISGKRPDLHDVPKVEGLVELIKDCWAENPADRPSFKMINERLQIVMVNAAISDLQGREFWRFHKFGERPDSTVPINEFIEKFYSFVGHDPEIVRNVIYWETKNEAKVDDPSIRYKELVDDEAMLSFDDNDLADEINGNSNSGGGNGGEDNEEEGRYGMLEEDEPAKPDNEDVYNYRSLVAVFSLHSEDANKKRIKYKDRKVTILHFGKVLKWFGPLEKMKRGTKSRRHDFVYRLKTTLRLPYFHGDIGQEEARRRLKGLAPGTFLIRLSGEPGFFVLSRMVGTKRPGTFKEGRIGFIPGKGLSVPGSTEYFPDLKKFISTLKGKLGISQMCTGSKYQDLFIPLFEEEEEEEKVKEEAKPRKKKSKSKDKHRRSKN